MSDDAIYQVHEWLEDDPDRRELRIGAHNCDLWWAQLWIDTHVVAFASGNDLSEVLGEVMEGMVIAERGGTAVEDSE